MKIDIDPASGVCFGVEKAILKAEELLASGRRIYGLGHLVHNQKEIERLEKLGMETISADQLHHLKNSSVLFRAHGEPPESYELARKNNNTIFDATCPIVLKLQKRVSDRYHKIDHTNGQIVIYGKREHPETIGLLGQIGGDATVISSVEDAEKIDPSRKVYLFSQTTMDPHEYADVKKALLKTLEASGRSLESESTICSQMKKREPSLGLFAAQYDVVIFVSGKHSSNGRKLFHYCKSVNANSYWISDESELRKEWFQDKRSAGISGATSTPQWQLEIIRDRIKDLTAG